MNTRLVTITENNKRNRLRDVLFAAFVMLATALAVTAMAEDYATQIVRR
ncbi:MAG: hypothetical protein H0V17_06250 [Deltaproteobacteria bacterium]|nr:hypothetical protein [Deltaproteobacteria bacterium]